MSEYDDGAFYWCLYGDEWLPARWIGPLIDPDGDAGSYFQPWGYEDDHTWPAPNVVGERIEPPALPAERSPVIYEHVWVSYGAGDPLHCMTCDVQWSPDRNSEPCRERTERRRVA